MKMEYKTIRGLPTLINDDGGLLFSFYAAGIPR
jgi:hypothetical protein